MIIPNIWRNKSHVPNHQLVSLPQNPQPPKDFEAPGVLETLALARDMGAHVNDVQAIPGRSTAIFGQSLQEIQLEFTRLS